MNNTFRVLTKLIIILAFRTFLWGLVTANFTNINLVGGLILSAVIPMNDYRKLKLRAILPSIIKVILIPMQLIKETIELISIVNPKDSFILQGKSREAMTGSNLARFMDVLLITSTPMTLVTGEEEDQWRIHTLKGENKK
jgi:multisubunit Na+/H+ antiporter MnhE subunit